MTTIIDIFLTIIDIFWDDQCAHQYYPLRVVIAGERHHPYDLWETNDFSARGKSAAQLGMGVQNVHVPQPSHDSCMPNVWCGSQLITHTHTHTHT